MNRLRMTPARACEAEYPFTGTQMIRLTVTPLVLCVIVLLEACSPKSEPRVDSTAAIASPTATDTGTTAGSQSSGMNDMQGMSGDADHDFLRMMSDHHHGLIAMAHPTIESKENLSVKPDAREMDKKQDAELKKMATMLDKQYKDAYTPKVMPDNQRMADELKTKSGNEYSRTFLANVIKHHEQAIKMIDDYLPKAKNAEVKSMAAKMKSNQTREIAKLKKELAST